jgi:hypothetical protein
MVTRSSLQVVVYTRRALAINIFAYLIAIMQKLLLMMTSATFVLQSHLKLRRQEQTFTLTITMSHQMIAKVKSMSCAWVAMEIQLVVGM